MGTRKQAQAAKRNIQKAQRAATKKRTIAQLPKGTRRELGKQAAHGSRARRSGGPCSRGPEPPAAVRDRQEAGHSWPLEDGQVGSDQGDPSRPL